MFGEYSDTIFIPRTERQLQGCSMFDIVWDRYRPTWQIESHNPRKTRERHTQKNAANVLCGFLTRFHKQGKTFQSADGEDVVTQLTTHRGNYCSRQNRRHRCMWLSFWLESFTILSSTIQKCIYGSALSQGSTLLLLHQLTLPRTCFALVYPLNLLCPCLLLRGKHGKHQAATAGFTSASFWVCICNI